MSDLRECPFCSGEAKASSRWGLDFVRCIGCGASSPEFDDHHEAARNAWNRRAPSAAFRAGAAEMRERVEKGLTNHAEQLRASAERALARGDKDQSAFTHGKATAIEVALIAIRALPLPAAPEEGG